MPKFLESGHLFYFRRIITTDVARWLYGAAGSLYRRASGHFFFSSIPPPRRSRDCLDSRVPVIIGRSLPHISLAATWRILRPQRKARRTSYLHRAKRPPRHDGEPRRATKAALLDARRLKKYHERPTLSAPA